MFFCEKCRYSFNITKDVKSKQLGGQAETALNQIFDKFRGNEKLVEEDLKNLTADDIKDDERFENLNLKDQRKLISNIKSVDKTFFDKPEETGAKIGTNKAYFICRHLLQELQYKCPE
jgi:type II secretory pathway predicted ATPase ExeA